MPTAATFGLFATAALALLLVPGPAVMFIVTRSAEHGRRVGLASVLGIHTGTAVHVVAASVGLSALLVRSAAAFTAVKLAGAAYLIALGASRLLRPKSEHVAEDGRRRLEVTGRQAYRQGIVVNVLNPKTALFFLAFLPQFVDPARGAVLVQTLVLGLTLMSLGLVTDSCYALAAGTLSGLVRRRTRRAIGSRLSGLVYIGLGVTAALTRRTTPGTTN